jgi:hypothetical protein
MSNDTNPMIPVLEAEIVRVNEFLGLTTYATAVSLGYLGNGRLTSKGWDTSGCSHFVFLPHPGRVGTAVDRVEYDPADMRSTAIALGKLVDWAAARKIAAIKAERDARTNQAIMQAR